jgi:hypothetical protein
VDEIYKSGAPSAARKDTEIHAVAAQQFAAEILHLHVLQRFVNLTFNKGGIFTSLCSLAPGQFLFLH